MYRQRRSNRTRAVIAAFAGITTLIVGAYLVSACGPSVLDGAEAAQSPGQNTSTTVVETTTLPPTTLPTTTTLPPQQPPQRRDPRDPSSLFPRPEQSR